MSGKVLIVYFSKGGATSDYAEVVAEVLRARGLVVDLVNLGERAKPDTTAYGTVVVGLGVRIGMVYRRGKRFLSRPELAGKRLAIFLSSGIAAEDPARSKEKFLTPLVEDCGLRPLMCDAFPGKVPGPGGELEDRTDPEVARRWAEELAAKLAEGA